PQPRRPALELSQRALEASVARLGQLDRCTFARLNLKLRELLANEQLFKLDVLDQVRLAATDLREVERRHSDVNVPAIEELGHVAVEEGQDQRPDVRAVYVSVGHDDDPVVAKLREVEFLTDAGSDYLHERLDLVIREDLADP